MRGLSSRRCARIALPGILLGKFGVQDFDDAWLSQRTFASFMPTLVVALVYIAYYAVPEGIWGASIGKALCGLRVIGPARGAPGVRLAAARASVCWVALNFTTIIALFATSAEQYAEMVRDEIMPGNWWFWIFFPAWFGLFITMRRGNGFAAIQDLLSGTRVVLKPRRAVRPRLELGAPPPLVAKEAHAPAGMPALPGGHLGPYQLGDVVGGGFVAGHDEVLRRKVWIRKHSVSEPFLPDARRDVARATRLRWIGGARSSTENWDAFEAQSGCCLTALPAQSQPWIAVHGWLADLAAELDAASKDGTLPAELTLAHVWLTSDGRAMLMDHACTSISESIKERDLPSPADEDRHPASGSPCAQKFLSTVAEQVLDPKTVPLHARDVLQKIAATAFDRISFVAGNLQSLLAKPAVLSRQRRAASLLLPVGTLLLLFALVQVSIYFEHKSKDARWREFQPKLPPLSAVLRMREAADSNQGPFVAWRLNWELVRDTGIHIVGHYLPQAAWADMFEMRERESPFADQTLPLTDSDRGEIANIFEQHWKARSPPNPPLKPDEVAAADVRLEIEMPKFLADERRHPWILGWGAARNILWATAIVQLLSLLIFGVTPGQRVFGFAVLNKKGERARRLRMVGRLLLAWAPLLLALAVLDKHVYLTRPWTTSDIVRSAGYPIIWLLGLIVAIANPPRGVHDEQAGTWLVPR